MTERTFPYRRCGRLAFLPALLALVFLPLQLLSAAVGAEAAAGEVTEVTPESLADRLEEVLHRRADSGARVAARVVDLSTGRELYRTANAGEPFIPASNMKVVVSAAALHYFRPDEVFRTYLLKLGDDLWIVGTGDPAVGDPRIESVRGRSPDAFLEHWARALKQRGVETVEGDLLYFDGAFDDHWVHRTWGSQSPRWWYGAAVSGLNLNNNCIDGTIAPGALGEPGVVTLVPNVTSTVRIHNRTVTIDPPGEDPAESDGDEAAMGNASDSTDSDSEDAPPMHGVEFVKDRAGSGGYTLTGRVAREDTLRSLPVNDPGAFFADAVRTALADHGITVRGATRRAPRPPLDRPRGDPAPPADHPAVVAVYETPLPLMLNRINTNSQNLLAEGLCKLTGLAWLGKRGVRELPGSWEAGEQAALAFLDRVGIEGEALVMTDGSGLSRANRVSADLMVDLFAYMHRRGGRAFEVFNDSLTVSGTRGTIGRRMTDIKGRVRAKTGYIGGVRALSGYVRCADDRLVAFSFLYNDIPGSVTPFNALQDEACRLIYHAFEP